MKIAKKLIYISITLTLIGCENESGDISAGVSLGGTGDPSIGGNLPPIKAVDPIEILSEEYILWSKGRIDQQCSGLKLSMQLMNPDTLGVLNIGNGYPIILGDIEHNRRVGIRVSIENETTSTLYNFSENCQPLLELKNINDEKQSLNFNFECTNQDSIIILKPGENLEYKYVFALPDDNLERNLVYTHKYSFDNIKTFVERDSCEVAYPLLLEK